MGGRQVVETKPKIKAYEWLSDWGQQEDLWEFRHEEEEEHREVPGTKNWNNKEEV